MQRGEKITALFELGCDIAHAEVERQRYTSLLEV